jgi:hypothetical protein
MLYAGNVFTKYVPFYRFPVLSAKDLHVLHEKG